MQIGTVNEAGPAATAWTLWSRWTPGTRPAPANTAYVRVELQRNGGGSGDAYVTGIEARKGDRAALARIAATEAVAARANGAISDAHGLINASFGIAVRVHLARPRPRSPRSTRLAAAWVLRQKAGAAVGTAEAVAFTDADGTPLATFRSTTTTSTSKAGSAPATW